MAERRIVNQTETQAIASGDFFVLDNAANGTKKISGANLVDNIKNGINLASIPGDTSHRTVSDTEKNTWNGKYTKPSSGIPKTDLASSVQTSLEKADSAISDAPSDNKQYARKNGSWTEVQGGGGGGASSWDDLDDKPFETIGSGLNVVNGVLNAVGSGGTSNYNDLSNRPQINSHILSGNQSASDLGLGTYSKPSSGIPKTDLASAVQASLGKADSAYQKASSGIPKTDLASAVQTSLGKADSAVQEAPTDGNQYARKNGAWEVVQGGSGGGGFVVSTTAPSDTSLLWIDPSDGGYDTYDGEVV